MRGLFSFSGLPFQLYTSSKFNLQVKERYLWFNAHNRKFCCYLLVISIFPVSSHTWSLKYWLFLSKLQHNNPFQQWAARIHYPLHLGLSLTKIQPFPFGEHSFMSWMITARPKSFQSHAISWSLAEGMLGLRLHTIFSVDKNQAITQDLQLFLQRQDKPAVELREEMVILHPTPLSS